MAETTTRGWAKNLAGQARRLRARCVDENAATLGDVEFLTLATEAMAGEIERLHGVIRDYQARVGEGAMPWLPQTGWLFKHASGQWELRYVYRPETNAMHPEKGWYLEGPGEFCRRMADDLGTAQRLADQHIAEAAR